MKVFSFDTVGSTGAAILAALGCALTTGCDGFYDYQDLEIARGEATYVSTELGATFAFALAEAQRFTDASVEAQVAYEMGSPLEYEGCATVQVADAVGLDGNGTVAYDLSGCPTSSGAVTVAQQFDLALPPGGGGSDGSGGYGGEVPPDVPPGTEASVQGNAIATADASAQVVFAGYHAGNIGVLGHMAYGHADDGGTIESGVTVTALDYRGRLDMEGEYDTINDGLATRMSFDGAFESSTGLDWTVVADNVVYQPGCMDALGGELLMIFDNPAGRVTVETVFDDTCDGCAALYVDGEQVAESCFGDGTTIGGVAQ